MAAEKEKYFAFFENFLATGETIEDDTVARRFYEAVAHYIFDGGELPEGLDKDVAPILQALRPSLDKSVGISEKRKSAGQKGGQANGSKSKQTGSKTKQTEANGKQNEANSKQTEANDKQKQANGSKQEANASKQGQETRNKKQETGNKKEKEREEKKARPENIQEEIDYFVERGSTEKEAQKFHDYWESIGWKRAGNRAIKDWKATARVWIARNEDGKEATDAGRFRKYEQNIIEI